MFCSKETPTIGKLRTKIICVTIPCKGIFFKIKEVIKNGPLKHFDYTTEKELDTLKIDAYKSFIKNCIDSNIKLFIVCPPYLINSTGVDKSIIKAKEIAGENNINFLDYSQDRFYISQPQLFADYRHLNEKGVALFSESVIEKTNGLKNNK